MVADSLAKHAINGHDLFTSSLWFFVCFILVFVYCISLSLLCFSLYFGFLIKFYCCRLKKEHPTSMTVAKQNSPNHHWQWMQKEYPQWALANMQHNVPLGTSTILRRKKNFLKKNNWTIKWLKSTYVGVPKGKNLMIGFHHHLSYKSMVQGLYMQPYSWQHE